MKSMQLLCGLMVCSIVLACRSASADAPTTAPADPQEVAAIRQSVDEFIRLLNKADTGELAKAFGGNDASLKVVIAFNDALHAAEDTKAALIKRFPDQMSNAANAAGPMDAMVKRMRTQGVTTDGNTAIIGNRIGGVTLKKVDGVWKVADLISDPDGKLQMVQILPKMTKALDEVRVEVDGGKYASVEEAQQALAKKIRLATAIFVPKTNPATRPAN